MASKFAKGKKVEAIKVVLDPILKTQIRAQMASAAPPLGPSLGQRGVNVANFCKDFNSSTAHIKQGTILPVTVHVKPDRSYNLEIDSPATTWLLKQAAGIRRDKQEAGEIVGRLSVKHIYEIAKIKSKDKSLVGVPLRDICQMVIQRAQTIGIAVQNEDLDPQRYKEFLDTRREIVKRQLEEITKKEQAKLLRA